MTKDDNIEDDLDFAARQLVFLTENNGESIQSAISKLLNDTDESIRNGAKTLHALILEKNTANLDKKSAFNVLSDILNLIQVSREQAGQVSTEFIKRQKEYRKEVKAYASSLKSSLSYSVILIVVTLIISAIYYQFILPSFKELYGDNSVELPALTVFMMEKGIYIIIALLILGGLFIGCLAWVIQAMRVSARRFKPVNSWVLKINFINQIVVVVNHYLIISYASILYKGMGHSGKVLSHAIELACGDDNSQLTDVVDHRQAIELKASENYKTLEQELEFQLVVASDKLAAQLASLTTGITTSLQMFLVIVIGGIVISYYLPIFKLGQIF